MNDLIKRAEKVYNDNFDNSTWFERAIFISWFCAKPTCKFCYMYTIKDNIKDPSKARRRLSSILAESLICKLMDWKIGFISSGIFAFITEEIKNILEKIHVVTGEKQWLNIGTLKEKQIETLVPHLEGVCGTIECINEELRNDIVPDKPIDEIINMFKICDKHGIKKAITMIIGLGETIDDFDNLKKFIKENNIDRINYYRLVPHEGADLFPIGPTTKYYCEWIAKTRIAFPKINIIAGSWPDRVDEIDILLKSGANNITKFPAIKLFNSEQSRKIEDKVKEGNRNFKSNMSSFPDIDIEKEIEKLPLDEELKIHMLKKINKYIKKMKKEK